MAEAPRVLHEWVPAMQGVRQGQAARRAFGEATQPARRAGIRSLGRGGGAWDLHPRPMLWRHRHARDDLGAARGLVIRTKQSKVPLFAGIASRAARSCAAASMAASTACKDSSDAGWPSTPLSCW